MDKTKTTSTRDTLQLLLNYSRNYWGLFILAVICLSVGGSLALAFPYYVGKLLDSAFTHHNKEELNNTLYFLVALLTLQSVFSFGRTYLINYIGERIVARVREDLYAHLVRLNLTFFANRRVGELTSRISSDVTLIQSGTTANLSEGLRQLMVFFGGTTLMFITNQKLTLLLLGVLPFIVAVAALFGRRIRKISTKVQDQLADASAILDETLSSIRTVQSFVREEYEVKRYSEKISKSLLEALRRAVARGGLNAFIVFILFNGIVLLLWYGGTQVLEGSLTVGQLTTFFLYTSVVGTALGAFTELYGEFNQTIGAARRVVELFKTEPAIKDPYNAKPLTHITGQIEFQNVTFSYPGHEDVQVLKQINIQVQPGEIIALVGPSGAGKSTIISLLPRFYDVTEGSICIDGQDLRTLQLYDLRKNIGIVPQETTLFSGSIRENISYGNLEATFNEIEQAAIAANAHEFITAFPDGYDAIIGERGVKLSGGQRQRISIARALLKNPKILILDEATSSLDSESEGLVQLALEKLMENRTTFVIAHRLSTIRQANRILVINEGYIVEEGTHEHLIEQNGLYAKLYNIQFQRH